MKNTFEKVSNSSPDELEKVEFSDVVLVLRSTWQFVCSFVCFVCFVCLFICFFDFPDELEKVEFSDVVLVLRSTWQFLLAAFLDFFVTLSVFPSLFGLTVRSFLFLIMNQAEQI